MPSLWCAAPGEQWTGVPATGTPERQSENAPRVSSGSRVPWGAVYHTGGWIIGVIVFFTCWIYAGVTQGLFIGPGLGWIPPLVIALIGGLLWPLIAVVIAVIAAVVIYAVSR